MSEKEIALAALSQAGEQELEDYKKWLNIPADLGASPFFQASNRMNWVKVDKYGSRMFLNGTTAVIQPPPPPPPCIYVRFKRRNQVIDIPEAPESRGELRKQPSKRRASTEVIEISSDDEPAPPRKKPARNIKSEPLPTSIPPSSVVNYKLTKKLSKDGNIQISQRESVEKVVQLSGIPERMPIPDVDTAYIIDFSTSDSKIARTETYTGRPKNLDRLLKAEDQDSWGLGTNGSTARPTKLTILDDLPSRRSTHYCKGGLRCEFFEVGLLAGYERDDPDDMDLTRAIFAQELEQSKSDSLTSVAVTAAFFRVVDKKKQCDLAGCPGKPILKHRKNGPSDEGKDMFVGCTKWTRDQQYKHTYFSIPSGVDEEVLARYMAGEAVDEADEGHEPSCYRLMHPRHGKQTACPHPHFREGKLVVGQMVPLSCPVRKIVYTSQEVNVKVLVVIYRGRHSHPPWPAEKPGLAANEDLDKCLTSMGTIGTTGGRLNNSVTTKALLGSSLDVKHPSWRNKRRLRDAVLSRKDASTPAGLLWAGILDKYEQDLKLSSPKRYIRIIRMEGDLKLAITMDSFLAQLIHEVQYLVPDFTFKRLKDLLNEWEVAVWLDGEKERVSTARIYCNKATADAFYYIFDGFFMAIEQVTGHPVRFKAFDPAGNIISINFDMEAAQVQGFAIALLKLLGKRAPTTDPDVIVTYVVKLCSVHFTRSTDALVGAVGQTTVNYLNRIRGLKTPEDIAAWHKHGREHPNKKLRDWYDHKMCYPWLLAGYNEYLSLFPPGFWNRTPNHTNLVESAHVATNRETGTQLLPLEAIQKARIFDAQRAVSIATTRDTCILSNHNNNDQNRMSRAVGRNKSQQKRRQEHTSHETELSAAVQRLTELTDEKKEVAAQVKGLKDEKKKMGRAPRNIHLTDRDGYAAMIPRVSSSASISADDDSDSDVEMVYGSESERGTRSASQASTPPLSGASDFEADSFSSCASEFGVSSGSESEPEWGHASRSGGGDEDDGEMPHVGHYLLGAPGFDLNEFLADCGTPFV
ncbi:hypothetical protein C8R43DRAFT_1115101 [Mycena crocata]|nr:hypothetical protein C8R43DRAFT_1115101 [Mycena crocata]